MTRFASTYGSDTDAISVLADLANFNGQRTVVIKAGATSALMAAEMTQALIRQSGTNGALSVLTDTAAALVARIPNVQVGSYFTFTITNVNDNTLTLVPGAGVTLIGSTAVPTSKSQIYNSIVTNATPGAEAVSIYGALITPT